MKALYQVRVYKDNNEKVVKNVGQFWEAVHVKEHIMAVDPDWKRIEIYCLFADGLCDWVER